MLKENRVETLNDYIVNKTPIELNKEAQVLFNSVESFTKESYKVTTKTTSNQVTIQDKQPSPNRNYQKFTEMNSSAQKLHSEIQKMKRVMEQQKERSEREAFNKQFALSDRSMQLIRGSAFRRDKTQSLR